MELCCETQEGRVLDIGDIPEEKDIKVNSVTASTKLNNAFDELLTKTIKANVKILRKYEQYDVLKELKASYEKLPRNLIVGDTSAIKDLFMIENNINSDNCMHEVRKLERELWVATTNLIVAKVRNETGAKYDAKAAKHPKLTKFFNGSREEAINNGDYGNSVPAGEIIDKYTECI